MQDEYDYLCKLIVFGDSGVGKTTLEKYIYQVRESVRNEGKIEEKDIILDYGSRTSVVGVGFQWITVEVKGRKTKLQIWVYTDREHFFEMKGFLNGLRGASGALLLYDVTNASSLNKIPKWCEWIAEQCGKIPIALIGNKVDVEEQQVISKERGIEVQKSNNLSFFMEISTKTGENVIKMLEQIEELMLEVNSNHSYL